MLRGICRSYADIPRMQGESIDGLNVIVRQSSMDVQNFSKRGFVSVGDEPMAMGYDPVAHFGGDHVAQLVTSDSYGNIATISYLSDFANMGSYRSLWIGSHEKGAIWITYDYSGGQESGIGVVNDGLLGSIVRLAPLGLTAYNGPSIGLDGL